MPEDFFAEEARIARAAMRNLVMETGKQLQRDADITPLIQQRPWASLAAAAGGGLVAGYLVTPPRRSLEEKLRREEIRREMRERRGKKPAKSDSGITGKLIEAVKPAVSTFAASLAGMLFHNVQSAQQEPPHDEQYTDVPPHPRMQL